MSLVTEDVIVSLSPVSQRLEYGIYLGHGYLKNNILKCFRRSILNDYETVYSKNIMFLKSEFLSSYVQNAMRSRMK